MIAIISALTREIQGLVRGLPVNSELRKRGVHLYQGKDVVFVAAGMGAERVALGVEAALKAGPITDLTSVGLAGACVAGIEAGSVLEADVVIEERTGERLVTSSVPVPPSRSITLVSTDSIASVKEKARLHTAYSAEIVDMEAATVGRLALAHGLRFRAIKSISDESDFELQSLGKFSGKHGSFRTGAFAMHTAVRPWTWGDASYLGRKSGEALKALEADLRMTLAHHKVAI